MPDVNQVTYNLSASSGNQSSAGSSPQKRKVMIYGFRGEGKYRHQPAIDGRLGFGHFGIKFDGDPEIYGFNPSQPAWLSVDDFITKLKNNTAFPGEVKIDTAVFRQAEALQIPVREFTYYYDEPTFRSAHDTARDEESQSRHAPLNSKSYAFPREHLPRFDPDCYNCATYFVSLQLATPCPCGLLKGCRELLSP